MNEFQSNASFTLSSANPRIPRYFYSSPPLMAMQNQREYRSLWFIVYGDQSPASQVNVHIDLKIDGLKKAINEERVRLNCPPLSNMLLWKPNTPISISHFEMDALDTSFAHFPDPSSGVGFDTKGAVQRLRITDTVFCHWRECPDESQLHIIAQDQCMFLLSDIDMRLMIIQPLRLSSSIPFCASEHICGAATGTISSAQLKTATLQSTSHSSTSHN
jgi:hypothetical protein